jgi:tetratricopeptide (TPR) repeat protein
LAKRDKTSELAAARRDAEVLAKVQSGIVFHQQGRVAEAARIYEEVLRQDANNFDALYLLGVAATQAGRSGRAVELTMLAIKINPGIAPAHCSLGNALRDLKRLDEALASYDRAIALNPNFAEAHNNRGNALRDLKRLSEALASFDRAASLKPDYAEAYYNRGNALRDLKRLDEALASYDRAISLKPNLAEAHSNRGKVLVDFKRLSEALASYDRAASLKPDYAETYYNRGNALSDLRRYDEALASFDRAISLKPNLAEAHSNRGKVLVDLKRLSEALASFDRAISLKPDYADAYLNKSIILLLSGQFEAGWKLYEWRKKKKEPLGSMTFPAPMLASLERVYGHTVLVHWEQGLGDTIQFCRYVNELQEAGANVLFAPQKRLRALLTSLGPTIQLVNTEDPSITFDYHVPLMSLPFVFGSTLETIPSKSPYLSASADRVRKWRERLGDRGFKIGICWKGNSAYKDDANRSFSVAYFEQISRIPNARLISLQRGESQLESLPAGMIFETLGADFDAGPDAFVDTAAVMKCLDLVIAPETAVAHLAGALGVPTWVALRYVPDWRWLLDRSDSPWYPTMRLFRQTSDGDWKGAFEDIEAALYGLVGQADQVGKPCRHFGCTQTDA